MGVASIVALYSILFLGMFSLIQIGRNGTFHITSLLLESILYI